MAMDKSIDVYEPPTVEDEADRLISYWERHGDNPEAVSRWAVQDLLLFARMVAETGA